MQTSSMLALQLGPGRPIWRQFPRAVTCRHSPLTIYLPPNRPSSRVECYLHCCEWRSAGRQNATAAKNDTTVHSGNITSTGNRASTARSRRASIAFLLTGHPLGIHVTRLGFKLPEVARYVAICSCIAPISCVWCAIASLHNPEHLNGRFLASAMLQPAKTLSAMALSCVVYPRSEQKLEWYFLS